MTWRDWAAVVVVAIACLLSRWWTKRAFRRLAVPEMTIELMVNGVKAPMLRAVPREPLVQLVAQWRASAQHADFVGEYDIAANTKGCADQLEELL